MLKKSYTWAKKKILWFFLGGVALAAGIDVLAPLPPTPPTKNFSVFVNEKTGVEIMVSMTVEEYEALGRKGARGPHLDGYRWEYSSGGVPFDYQVSNINTDNDY